MGLGRCPPLCIAMVTVALVRMRPWLICRSASTMGRRTAAMTASVTTEGALFR